MSEKPLVTVGLASRNETAMLVMTVLSALEALKAAGVDGEVLVVENSDEDMHRAACAALQGAVKDGRVRVKREADPSIAVATDRAHREAEGEFVFYTDAHSLIGAGTFERMLDFFKRHEGEPVGFLYAPIQWAHLSAQSRATHMQVQKTQLGVWAGARKLAAEQRVTWKGMPHMIRKSTYEAMGGLGCCAEHRLGWGIMRYLGMKPWLMGYENWAIPEGVVYHFGEWPEEVRKYARYRTYKKSGEGSVGTTVAVTAYVFGGEAFLRQEHALHLQRFFPTPEAALEVAKKYGEEERQWLLKNQKRSLEELFETAPWGVV